MSCEKDLTILALSKMHGGVCTAGIDGDGKWVRPVRSAPIRKEEGERLTDRCLVTPDFFHGGQSHLCDLGVTRFFLTEPAPSPPHGEDWIIDLAKKPQLIETLTAAQQAEVLARTVEDDLAVLEPGGKRSLGLFSPEEFSFSF